ncbi:hypothetical protein MMC13_001385 [Lambiella insularis]|nr:hypothetical protein [Lambiella insularis]
MGKTDLNDDYFQEWCLGLEINDDEPPEDAWIRARGIILRSKEFSEEEHALLENGSLHTVTQDLRDLEAKHAKGSHVRRLASNARLKPVLDGLVNLDTAISSIAAADPHGIATLLWGGISIVCKVNTAPLSRPAIHLDMLFPFSLPRPSIICLHSLWSIADEPYFKVAQAALKIPETLLDFLNRIGWTLSRLQLYENLSSKSPRLNRVLMHVFIKYLSLCLYLRDSFINDGSLRHRWKTSLRFGTEAFTGSMTMKMSELDLLCVDAHQEAQLAITNALLKNIGRYQQVLDNLSEAERQRQRVELKNQKVMELERAKGRFLKWLRHVPAAEDLHKLRKEQLDGTCEWIANDELISSWLGMGSMRSSLLWISGGPGTGKTILSAHIIGEIQHRHPIAYFFCKSDDQRKQTTTAVLQNWIWQLVHDSPVLPESITSPSDEYQAPSHLVLSNTMLALQQYLRRSYLVVDGLDECIDDVSDFLQCCQVLSEKWSVLIISRDVVNIQKALSNGLFNHKALTTEDNKMDIQGLIAHKAIGIQDTKQDIDTFVNQKTEELAVSKSWQAMEKGIANVLSKNAEGMFLWVRLVLDFLLEDTTLEADVEEALGSIPSDLNGFYDKIVEKMKIQPGSWKIAQRALQWIVFAFRPLTLEELHAAIACELNFSKPIENFELVLRGSCGLLIRIDDESGKVTIIHTTVKEYLLEATDVLVTAPSDGDTIHARMTATCLVYINAKNRTAINVDNDVHQSEQRFQTYFDSPVNYFLDYSVVFWCQHLNKSPEQSALWQASLVQLCSSEEVTVIWLQLFQYLHSWGRPGTQETAELLHTALQPVSIKEGLRDVFEHEKLLSFRTHLGLADGKRFLRWDRFLIGAGDLPSCFPIILVAAHFNFVDIIRREIRRRVDIETKSHRGGTGLLWAARAGSSDAVRYFLSKKIDINDQSRVRRETPLAKSISSEFHLATFPGTYPIVQILLEAGASPDMADYDGSTALNTLVGSNNSDGEEEASVVNLLLKYSPNLWKTKHKTVGSILRHAISSDKPRIAGTILEQIRVQDPSNATDLLEERFEDDTALHFALQENVRMVPLLLEFGANLNAPDARRVLPLQFAAQHNLGSAAKSLIEKGCDVGTRGWWDKTPLTIALESQSMDAVSVLLDMGASNERVPEPLMLLPRSTTLDNRLRSTRLANIPSSVCTRDVYHICYHFKEVCFLPIPITARILDMAEFWVQSSVIRDDLQVYTDSDVRRTYLRSAPIFGREASPVQKIMFTITGHDQGWDSNEAYSGNWTWFETRRLPGGDSKREQSWPSIPKITFNRHAEWDWHSHQITWSCSQGPRNWDLIKPGDRISVIACARFHGWCNYVGNMRMDIFTSILRRHYTRNEVFEIWDSGTEKYLRKSNTFEKAWSQPELPQLNYVFTGRSRLQILAANFGTLDVTNLLAELVIDNRSLDINTDSLSSYFGDPWFGICKVLSFLYQFSDEGPQLFITAQGRGTVLLDSNTFEHKAGSVPKPLGAGVQILAIVYGDKEVTAEDTYERVYSAIIQGYHLTVSNEVFGDSWPGMRKSCTVYYRRTYGPIVSSAAKEGDTLKWEL